MYQIAILLEEKGPEYRCHIRDILQTGFLR